MRRFLTSSGFSLLFMAILSVCLFANAGVYSGDCGANGDNVKWELDTETGVLAISGVGEMKGYSSSSSIPWDLYEESIKTVVIGDGVTSISDSAFSSCTNLVDVTIGNGVTSIGDGAFFNCTRLASIKIPDSVKIIARFAFFHCTNLTSITIPNSVTSIGDEAFSHCTSLAIVNIPDSVTSIGDWAFFYCTSLVIVNIPDSVTSIGDHAFSHCTSLVIVNIPDSVTSIGDDAFFYCTSLTNVTIGNGVTNISFSEFNWCESLTNIIIPNSVTSIGDIAFSGCTNLESITIPNSVTSIGDRAFSGCRNLTDIYFSGTEEQWKNIKIGEEAIPDGVNIHFMSTFEEYFAQNINHYYPFTQDKFAYADAVDLFIESGYINKAIAYKTINDFSLKLPINGAYNYSKAYYEMLLLSIITKQYADDEYSESLVKKASGLADSIVGAVADAKLGTDMKAMLGKMKASSVVSSLLSPNDITSVVLRLDNDIDNFKSEKELATALATQITIMQNREGLVSCLKLMAEFCKSSGEAEIPGGLYDAIIKTINQIETTEVYIDYSKTGNLDVKSMIVNTFNDFTIRLWDNMGKLIETVANSVPVVAEMLLARDATSFVIECIYPCGNISDCVWQLACIDIIGTYADAAFVRAKNNYNANPTLTNAKAVLGTYDFLLSTTDCGQNQLKLYGKYHYNCGIWSGIFADEKKADYETWIEYAESTDVGVRYNRWIRDNIALDYGFEKKEIVPVWEVTIADGKVTNTEQNIIPYNSTYYFKKDSPMIPASLKDVFYITSVSDCYYDKEFTKPYTPTAITEPLTLYREVTLVKNPNIVNNYLNTDIKAYIDGKPIESYNIDGNTVVIVENLMEYGFDVLWDGAKRTLAVTDGKKNIFSKFQHGKSIGQIGIPMGYVFKTDIKTYVNGKQVTSYNIGGMTAIPIDDLGAFGNVKWDGDARTISFSR